jgi:hypothetical protein
MKEWLSFCSIGRKQMRPEHRNLDLEQHVEKKRANFFQLVSTLFCEVKRGVVEPCKNVPM